MTAFQKQQGVGLVELMVAVVILSVSLLSIASLQTRSLQYNQSAYWLSQANILAYDMMDRIRLNKEQLNQYNMAFGASSTGSGQSATDTVAWLNNVKAILPTADAAISCTVANSTTNEPAICSVSLSWEEESVFGFVTGKDESGADARTTITYVMGV